MMDWQDRHREKERGEPAGWGWTIGLIVIMAALLSFLLAKYPDVWSGERRYDLLTALILLFFVASGGLVRGRRFFGGDAIRYGVIWAGIASVFVVGYTFRVELRSVGQRIWAELVPGQTRQIGERVLELRASVGGHFHVDAMVQGKPVRFLVDTGASDVTLTLAAARRLGLSLSPGDFRKVYRTANGIVRGAPVTLKTLTIGPLTLRNVKASVNGAAMDESLLGMTFLKRLKSYEFQGDRLRFKW